MHRRNNISWDNCVQLLGYKLYIIQTNSALIGKGLAANIFVRSTMRDTALTGATEKRSLGGGRMTQWDIDLITSGPKESRENVPNVRHYSRRWPSLWEAMG